MTNQTNPTKMPTEAMLSAGRGAWLDYRGYSDDDALNAIYLAMQAARPLPSTVADNEFCSHPGSCADNFKTNGGAFCANRSSIVVSDLMERLHEPSNQRQSRRVAIEYEAADALKALDRKLGMAVKAMENALAMIKRARSQVPDEEEGLAARIFAQHINWADGPLIEALSAIGGGERL